MMTGLSLFLLLLVLFAVAINLYRIEVDGEGIRKSMYWNAGRFIAWSDISAVRLTAGSGRNGPYETLRISSPAATITTGTRLDGFGNLKEYVLSHISPELVQGAASLPTSARPPEHRAERNEVHDSHVRE